jgi:uncharacterized delta-60 repeat protein
VVGLPDGKALIGGRFRTVNGVPRSGIARLNADGSLDASFDPGAGIGGSTKRGVNAILAQPDGRIVIGGQFSQVDGVDRLCLARLEGDGTLDKTYVSSGRVPGLTATYTTYAVYCLAPAAGGEIWVGGQFDQCVARLNANGDVDPIIALSFVGWGHAFTSIQPEVQTIAALANGQIFIQGFFSGINDVMTYGLARLNADGGIDRRFHSLPPGAVVDSEIQPPSPAAGPLAVQADGRPILGSSGRLLEGERLFRLDAKGNYDESFHPQLPVTSGYGNAINFIGVQPDGRILLSADFELIDGETRHRLARLNPDGGLDYQFAPEAGTDIPATVIAVQSDSSYLVGGAFMRVNGAGRPYLARLYGDANGSRPPVIDIPPARREAHEGGGVTLAVGAEGPALRYQWQLNNRPIPGATNSGLIIARTRPTDAGDYAVAITNDFGSVTSAPVALIVDSLADALNAQGLTWSTEAGYSSPDDRAGFSFYYYGDHLDIPWDGEALRTGWLAETQVTHDGVAAVQFNCPGAKPDLNELAIMGEAELETIVKGPGQLSFWWKLAAPITNGLEWNGLSFQIGGGPGTNIEATGINADLAWRQVVMDVPVGEHALTWTARNNRGYLDEVNYLADSSPKFQTAPLRFSSVIGLNLELKGRTGDVYRVERSEDLRTWKFWIAVTNLNGTLDLLDASATGHSQSFYRAVVQ